MGKRLIAILLVFAASLPAAGSVWLLCQDGMLHAACCCASGETRVAATDADEATNPAQLRRADCCTVTQIEKAPVVPVAGIDEFELAAPTIDVQARFAWKADNHASQSHLQPALVSKVVRFQTGPPRFIAHCSWLI